MKKQFRENLFSPVLYLFLSIALILINLTWFLPTRNSLRENISRLEAEEAEKAKISVSTFIKEKTAELKAAVLYFNYPLDDQKNAFVIRKLLREKSFTQITLLDGKGNEIFKISRIFSAPFLNLENKSDSPEFREVLKTGKMYLSEVKFSYNFEPYILAAFPVSFVEGEIVGVAVGELNIRPMFDYISGIKLGDYGTAYIVDKNGVLISHSDLSLVLKQRDYFFRKIVPDVLLLQRTVVSNDDKYTYVNEEGVEVLAAASFIPEINSAVIFEEPRREAIQSLKKVDYFFLLVVLSGLAIVFGLRKINLKLISTEKKIEKLREEYTAIMAHEMRAPIEGIRKVSEVLLEEKIKKDETVHDNFVRMIISNATAMLQLINDYLDVAKLKAGKLEISYAKFEFEPLVNERIQYFEPLAAEKKLRFAVEISPDTPKTLLCDKMRLTQVFNNLISNAIKFNKTDGEIRVQALAHKKNGDITEEARQGGIHWFVGGAEPVWKEIGDAVVLAVTDTGQGIAEEDIPKLFTEFTQVAPSGRKGTGLGLVIIKGLIEAHGGSVHIASKLGEGSTFYFVLPVKQLTTDNLQLTTNN